VCTGTGLSGPVSFGNLLVLGTKNIRVIFENSNLELTLTSTLVLTVLYVMLTIAYFALLAHDPTTMLIATM
jgi:hypothetical protein